MSRLHVVSLTSFETAQFLAPSVGEMRYFARMLQPPNEGGGNCHRAEHDARDEIPGQWLH
jgi:hypothetical protein